jgi:hypothetical protein
MALERLTTINNAGISSSLVFTGIITAASFVGDGGGLTGGGGCVCTADSGSGGDGIVIIAYPS